MLDKTDIQRIAISSIGAVALTAASIFAAAAPARAATPNAPATVAEWQQGVERQLGSVAEDAAVLSSTGGKVRKVVMTARFTADGDYAGAQIAQSSGRPVIDRQALRVTNAVDYPPLPSGYRGIEQQVTVRLYFGDTRAAALAAKRDSRMILAQNNAGGTGLKLAAR
jgi:TonB family protein